MRDSTSWDSTRRGVSPHFDAIFFHQGSQIVESLGFAQPHHEYNRRARANVKEKIYLSYKSRAFHTNCKMEVSRTDKRFYVPRN
jgi:hypothetical protein